MALFPKIDQPCPLGIDERKRIQGYCGRCDKAVHSLDGMNEVERRALLANAKGAVCVSYGTPARRTVGVGLGAAFALSMAGPAFAIDSLSLSGNTGSNLQSVDEAQAPTIGADARPTGSTCHDGQDALASNTPADAPLAMEFITAGGVSDPASAEWVDDSSLPDLPMMGGDVVSER